jgi:hypothetical protein
MGPIQTAPNLGQVVVGGDQVRAAAGERVQVEREGGHEGLALTGLQLCNAAVVRHHPTDKLHVVVPLAQGALARLTDYCESLRQDHVQHVVQRLARLVLALGLEDALTLHDLEVLLPLGLNAGAELVRLLPQLRVGQLLDLGLEGVDLVDHEAVTLDVPLVVVEEVTKETHLV